jgi:hypothetical protein
MSRRGLEPVPIQREDSAPRCGACWSLPATLRVHRSEKGRALRAPRCPFCKFSPRVEITDDPAGISVVGPGEFGGS